MDNRDAVANSVFKEKFVLESEIVFQNMWETIVFLAFVFFCRH